MEAAASALPLMLAQASTDASAQDVFTNRKEGSHEFNGNYDEFRDLVFEEFIGEFGKGKDILYDRRAGKIERGFRGTLEKYIKKREKEQIALNRTFMLDLNKDP